MKNGFLDRLDRLLQEKIGPLAVQSDLDGVFCEEAVNILFREGFMGLPYSKEQGGAGASFLEYVQCVERLATVSPSLAVTFSTHVTLACLPLYRYGTEQQKEQILLSMLTGGKLGAFALTEPEAGSDVGAISTSAEKDGPFYVINGRKIFITNAGRADVYILFARTSGKGIEGLSAFIIKKEDAGVIISAPLKKMGLASSHTCELFFEDLCIPQDRLIGREGDGFKIAMEALNEGRICIAAQSVGISEAAIAASRERLLQRKQFGRPLSKNQGLQWKLADMWTRTSAARQLLYHAGTLRDQGLPFRKEASAAKLFASDCAVFCSSEAVQIFGGQGYMHGMEVERLYRDARITQIYEGTNEIQRMIIASDLLG